MARHITDRDIEKIVSLFDGWSDKLTWEALCDACLPVIGVKPARQTLMKFIRIRQSFDACKKGIRDPLSKISMPPTLQLAAERINRLERENERLKRENYALLQQFIAWQYNAYVHGITESQLNKVLPTIDRGQTG